MGYTFFLHIFLQYFCDFSTLNPKIISLSLDPECDIKNELKRVKSKKIHQKTNHQVAVITLKTPVYLPTRDCSQIQLRDQEDPNVFVMIIYAMLFLASQVNSFLSV